MNGSIFRDEKSEKIINLINKTQLMISNQKYLNQEKLFFDKFYYDQFFS